MVNEIRCTIPAEGRKKKLIKFNLDSHIFALKTKHWKKLKFQTKLQTLLYLAAAPQPVEQIKILSIQLELINVKRSTCVS